MEHISPNDEPSSEEKEKSSEEHFQLHTKRNDVGKYIVRLPYNHNKGKLGASYSTALKWLHALENYTEFMSGYSKLKRRSIPPDMINTNSRFHLIRHAVIKHESIPT